jgi:hypothetical protein
MRILSFIALAIPLAACSQAGWARIATLPTDISTALILTASDQTYAGNARPGPLPGQVVTVTSADGAQLECAFLSGDWKYSGPGTCRSSSGRQFTMIVGHPNRIGDR